MGTEYLRDYAVRRLQKSYAAMEPERKAMRGEKSLMALAPEETRYWGGLSLRMPPIVATVTEDYEAYHGTWSRIPPECPDSDPPDRSVAADVLLRQEPAEEEEEEEEDDKNDDGYSE